MALNPVTGKPVTNAEKAQLWSETLAPVQQAAPTGTFQPANWSKAGLNKAKGAAKPLENRPEKGPSNVNRNVTGGKKLFRKTRKSRKSRKAKGKSRKYKK
jgi:hypothetical protein